MGLLQAYVYFCTLPRSPQLTTIISPAERGPPREDLPLPTEPPFTAFVGNLAFDLNEPDLEEFFAGLKVGFSPIWGLPWSRAIYSCQSL